MLRDPLGHPPAAIHAEVQAAQHFRIDQVEPDFLIRIAQNGSHLSALSELISNGFDAGAKLVEVKVERGDLHGIESIIVIDNGSGISLETARTAFKSLGGSRKAVSTNARQLHGRRGQGRLRAFKLGALVTWDSVVRPEPGYPPSRLSIESHITRPAEGTIKTLPVQDRKPGTVCTIRGIHADTPNIASDSSLQQLLETFALRLQSTPGTRLVVDGHEIDPSKAMEGPIADFNIGPINIEGNEASARLRICRWKAKVERKLMLCDRGGFTLQDLAPGIHAPGFVFTAYLLSEKFEELDLTGELSLSDMHPAVHALVDPARDAMRSFFRQIEAEQHRGLVEQWIADEIYPYQGEPESVAARASRDVFDIVASRIHIHSKEFENLPIQSRRLSFELLRTAVESGSDALLDILGRVIKLPKEDLDDLSELLEQTPLESIIKASKVIADRLHFLTGLSHLVHSPDLKTVMLERKHLHRMVEKNAWLFGEQYHLAASDVDLTTLLREHLAGVDREVLGEEPVVRADGRQGIPDLVLGQTSVGADRTRSNLVIELKRPSYRLDQTSLTQVKSYAAAIAADRRFPMENTVWEFWLVSTDIADDLLPDLSQGDRPRGMVFKASKDRPYTIWVRTWGEIINDCKYRMQFVQEKYGIQPSLGRGMELLRRVHDKHLPAAAKAAAPVQPSVVAPLPRGAEPAAREHDYD